MSDETPRRAPYAPPRLEPLGPWTLRLGVEVSFGPTTLPVLSPADEEGLF